MKNVSILSKELRKRAFLEDIKKVYQKHGLSIASGTCEAYLEEYTDRNIEWLDDAVVDFKENSSKEDNFIKDENFEKLVELLDIFDLRCDLIIENDIITKNRYGQKDIDICNTEYYKYNYPLTKEVYNNEIRYYISEKEIYDCFRRSLSEVLANNKHIGIIKVFNRHY